MRQAMKETEPAKNSKEKKKMRNWVSSSSVYEFILGLYKSLVVRTNELTIRLYGVRGESWSIVVFANGTVSEVQYK